MSLQVLIPAILVIGAFFILMFLKSKAHRIGRTHSTNSSLPPADALRTDDRDTSRQRSRPWTP